MSDRSIRCYGGQSPRSEEFAKLFAEGDRLINSIHNNIKNYSNGFASRFDIPSSRFRSQPPRNLEKINENHRFGAMGANHIDNEIAKIHRCCQNIENNLASMRLPRNTNRFGVSSNFPAMSLNRFSSMGRSASHLNLFGELNMPRRRSSSSSSSSSASHNNIAVPSNEVPELISTHFNFNRQTVGNVPTVSRHATTGSYAIPVNDDNANQNGNNDDNSIHLINQHRRHNDLLTELRAARKFSTNAATTTQQQSLASCYLRKQRPWQRTTEFYKCPICLENIQSREPFSTICGHVYCGKCINTALTVSRICPVCKKRLSKRQIFRIYL